MTALLKGKAHGLWKSIALRILEKIMEERKVGRNEPCP